MRESPSEDKGTQQPCTFTALEQSSLNAVVSSLTREIISIEYSPNSSTFPQPWKSGTQQWSSLAKWPSVRPKFRMGQFWNSWLLHLRSWVSLWTVETDEINTKQWNVTGTIMGKPLPELPSVVPHFYAERLKSHCISCPEKALLTIFPFSKIFDIGT